MHMLTPLFAIKCVAIPLLVVSVSWVQKKWGQYAAGALNGLPLFSGPVSVFLAIEQGLPFATEAAKASAAGQIAFFAYTITYLELARRYGWLLCSITAVSACLLILILLGSVSLPPVQAFALGYGSVLVYIAYLRRQPRKSVTTIKAMPHALKIRALASVAILLAVTGFAEILGPTYAGSIVMLPVIGSTVYAFTHHQNGRDTLVEFARGSGMVYFGFITYFLVVYQVGQNASIATTYLSAVCAALACACSMHCLQSKYRITYR